MSDVALPQLPGSTGDFSTRGFASRLASVTPNQIEREWCRRHLDRFIDRHCRLQTESGAWEPFRLWPKQRELLATSAGHRLNVWLKARQLGLTWLSLADAIHEMVYRPGITVLLFSLREGEAKEILERLKGMYERLPEFLKAPALPNAARAEKENTEEFVLPNGARAKAFPSNRGDSYTAALAIIDEADLIPNLSQLLGSVKPTIDAGGRLIMLSRSNKSLPESTFKKIYRAARSNPSSPWKAQFLPWNARPDRDEAFYKAQVAHSLGQTNSLDGVHEHYPLTDAEALAPNSLDKRIPSEWLDNCYREQAPAKPEKINGKLAYAAPSGTDKDFATLGPAIPGLVVYVPPSPGHWYVIGGDPAEGNPTSDDSAFAVLDGESGEEVAALAGKYEPAVLAAHIDSVGVWYNRATVMIERNNHGHAVLLWLRDNSKLRRLCGHDGKEGWLSSTKGKAQLYDNCADVFRNGETTLHTFETYCQLASIEGSTLRAPESKEGEGEARSGVRHDDRADAYSLALAARIKGKPIVWRMESF